MAHNLTTIILFMTALCFSQEKMGLFAIVVFAVCLFFVCCIVGFLFYLQSIALITNGV